MGAAQAVKEPADKKKPASRKSGKRTAKKEGK